MRRHSWLALALIASLLAACGGDEEPSSEEVKKPELTVPQGETDGDSTDETTDSSDSEATETGPGEPDAPMDQPNTGNGGVPAPDDNEAPAQPPDTPSNDRPPEPGSPAERFEQFCAQNPGAC